MQDTLNVETSETLQQLQNLHKGAKSDDLPVGRGQKPEETPVVAAESSETPVIDDNAEKYEYDGQTFATEKDMFEYMRGRIGQLETERLIEEARLEGRNEVLQYIPQVTGTGAQSKPEAEPEETVDMDKFYENPAQFLKDYGKKIYDKVTNEVTAAQKLAQQSEKLWSDFTNRHPDLADFREDVDMITDMNREMVIALAKKDRQKAMDYIATKTRERFQRYAEALKPTRTLTNAKAGPSVGGNTPVTNPARTTEVPKQLDFASQLRSIRKR